MKKIFTTIISLLAYISSAQSGAIDITFNPNDVGFGSGTSAENSVWTTSIQSDGKIIIGGTFTFYNKVSRNRIARLNVDGTLDTSFNPGTGANNIINTISIQKDGKIIIGGDFTSYNGVNINYIARLNTDGSLDTSFNTGKGADNSVRTTSIQNDGKIIISGYFRKYNDINRNYIARLNPDGTIDTSFNIGTGANNIIETCTVQSDGKIVIGGNFASYNGSARNGIARLNIDGTLDTSFSPGTGANSGIMSTSIQNDGKIIIGGNFTSFNGISRNRIARLNSDGTLEESFNPGTGANNTVWSTSIQNDGKIIIGGSFTSYDVTLRRYIIRLNSNGGIDYSFNIGLDDKIYTTSILDNGKIIIGGDFTSSTSTWINKRIAILNVDGTIDNFSSSTGANNTVETTTIQKDGKIIIGGDFTSFNGEVRNRIARLNTDGTLDKSFNPGSGPTATSASSNVYTNAIQNDGKILIGGYFHYYNGINRNNIARLNTDGTLDTSFNPGTGTNSDVRSISIQSDGKIIIVGYFSSFNGNPRKGIARLNTDGTIDTSFNPGTGANSNIMTISIQSDGKIIIGGEFTSYNDITINRIARLNTDGTIDLSFNPGTGADRAVLTTSVQNDGKIIIGGGFGRYNNTVRNFIARLNTNGTLDNSFNLVTSSNNWKCYTTSIQSDGKIIIGGDFSTSGINRFTRLNTDGTLDTTFNAGTGAKRDVITTSIQSDGKLIIGGDFTEYNSIGRNRIARINTDNQLNTSDLNNSNNNDIVIYPNPSRGVINLNATNVSVIKYIELYTVLGQKLFSKKISDIDTSIDLSDQPKGLYIYKLYDIDGRIKSGKLVIN